MNFCALKKQALVFSTDTAFHQINAENATILFYRTYWTNRSIVRVLLYQQGWEPATHFGNTDLEEML
jgi:hypothetical protein